MKSEKIRALATFNTLPPKHQKAIMMLFAGGYKQADIASQLHVAESTFYSWKTHENFRQAQDEYNRFMLRDLTNEAILTMRQLLGARSEMVRFNAAKDILDRSMSDAQARKMSAEADIAEIQAKMAKQGNALPELTIVDSWKPDDGGDDQ